MPKFEAQIITHKIQQRIRKSKLSTSKFMIIIIYFHHSNYRIFKHFYINYIKKYFLAEFFNLVSYQRFIELILNSLIPLICYINTRKRLNTGISFIDSTSISICHPKRAKKHKVFKELAAWGKSSIGWYFWFKLHLIINDVGDLLGCQITPVNVDDRVPVPLLTRKIFGKTFGDKGYISHYGKNCGQMDLS